MTVCRGLAGVIGVGALCSVLAVAEPTTVPQRPPVEFVPPFVLNPVVYRDGRDGDLFYPVNINNWWGFCSQSGDLIVFPAYHWTDYFYENRARAVFDGKTGYLKTSGNWLIDPVFPYADRFQEGYAVVGDKPWDHKDTGRYTGGLVAGGKYGFIDLRAKLLTPVVFDGALRFQEGYAAVQVGDLIGFINKGGKMAISPRFAMARSFHEGLAAAQLPPPPEEIAPRGGTLPGARVKLSGAQGDTSGGGGGGIGFVDKTGRFRFFDTSGRILDLGDFHEGYARVLVRGADGVGRWGYLDRGYALRIPPRYEDARDFHGGSAAVKRDGRWGYIDKADRVRVGFAYEAADDFDGVLAMVSVTQTVEAKVKAGAGVGVEDGADLRGGKEQPPGRAGETSGGWGGVGFVDKTGQRGIAPVFAWGESLAQRWVRVALTPNFGYLDVSGRLWWDPRAPAQRGIIDTRRGARARAVASRTGVGDPLLPLPPLRETELPPYPPEYTYVEVLPVGWDPDPAD